jgi:hypothetical protein
MEKTWAQPYRTKGLGLIDENLSPAASKGARFSGIIGGQGATRLREGGLRQTAAAGA